MAGKGTDAYQRVTDAILLSLDRGTVPWRKPWRDIYPRSMATGKQYSGVNPMLMVGTAMANGYASAWWGTYKRITELGGQVEKGEKSTPAVYWKILRSVDKDTQEEKTFPMLRVYAVFNAEQADWPNGLPERFTVKPGDAQPLEAAEKVSEAYVANGGPILRFGGDRACYSPPTDTVTMPELDTFATTEGYYATLFHEYAHSTGHKERLNRETLAEGSAPFGSPVYSREELVAELGSAMVCGTLGIDTPDLLDNAAAYIASWKKMLAEDSKALVWAAGRAQKAADLILGKGAKDATGEEETAEESE